MTLDELIEALEQATGPKFGLDSWIAFHVTGEGSEVKPYTASLDAALTLVPTDLAIIEMVLGWDPSEPSVHPAAVVRWYPPHVAHDGKLWHAQIASAKTLPLTVCLASLQARRAAA